MNTEFQRQKLVCVRNVLTKDSRILKQINHFPDMLYTDCLDCTHNFMLSSSEGNYGHVSPEKDFVKRFSSSSNVVVA